MQPLLPVNIPAPMPLAKSVLVSNIGQSTSTYEMPVASGNANASTVRLNSELDSFYSDIASIECNQVADQEGVSPAPASIVDNAPSGISKLPGAGASQEILSVPIEAVSANKGTVVGGEKVSKGIKKKKKVKTSLSDIKDMSHLISKWQKAQQDL